MNFAFCSFGYKIFCENSKQKDLNELSNLAFFHSEIIEISWFKFILEKAESNAVYREIVPLLMFNFLKLSQAESIGTIILDMLHFFCRILPSGLYPKLQQLGNFVRIKLIKVFTFEYSEFVRWQRSKFARLGLLQHLAGFLITMAPIEIDVPS